MRPAALALPGASWRRRRRLLFGILDPSPFESTPVRQQYSEIPQEGDFVFGRFAGGLAEADSLRRLCNENFAIAIRLLILVLLMMMVKTTILTSIC